MKAVNFMELLLTVYETTWRHVPECSLKRVQHIFVSTQNCWYTCLTCPLALHNFTWTKLLQYSVRWQSGAPHIIYQIMSRWHSLESRSANAIVPEKAVKCHDLLISSGSAEGHCYLHKAAMLLMRHCSKAEGKFSPVPLHHFISEFLFSTIPI
jgi:hypothetical protein